MPSSLFDYFDRVSIIHLPERTDRMQAMRRELSRIGVDFRSDKVVVPYAPKPANANGFPSKGVYGNFLSHLGILKAAHDDGLSNILLLEDDAIFSTRFNRCQGQMAKVLQHNPWDIFFIGHSFRNALPKSPSGIVRFSGSSLWSHCYAVNRSLMPRIIDYLEQTIDREAGHPDGGKMYIDGALNEFRRLNPDAISLASSPCLSVQRGSPSNIGTMAHWYDANRILRLPINCARSGRDALWRFGFISIGPPKTDSVLTYIREAIPFPDPVG